METQRIVALGVFIFIHQVSYFHTINGHACIPEERIDSSGKHRWSVTKVERCNCQAIVIPRVTTSRHQRCANNSDNYKNEELFFIDDIKQLTNRQNWVKDKLDVLLDRDECYVNECDSVPCLNKAVCHDRVGRYICQCGRGFEGVNCETDIEAPEIVCPSGQQTVTTDLGKAFASFAFDTFATDNSGKTPAVYCSKSSQSPFEIGETNVTCTSFDEANNKGTCYFVVSVEDTEDPQIICPANQFKNAELCKPNIVLFNTKATDNSLQSPLVSCTKQSGDHFNIGETSLTCTASDGAGNTATCQFSVNIVGTQVVCSAGWLELNNCCYYFSNKVGIEVTYSDADQRCKNMGGNLASIHSAEEQQSVVAHANMYDWIGLNDLVVEGTYIWTDGTRVSYTNWYNGAPHGDKDLDCVSIFIGSRSGGWEDHVCSHTHGFICKK